MGIHGTSSTSAAQRSGNMVCIDGWGVVRAGPLQGIGVLRQPEHVVKRGTIIAVIFL